MGHLMLVINKLSPLIEGNYQCYEHKFFLVFLLNLTLFADDSLSNDYCDYLLHMIESMACSYSPSLGYVVIHEDQLLLFLRYLTVKN